jgi:hypothetical protein
VHLVSCRCSLCTILCRCSSVLVVLCSVFDVVFVFSRLIPVRLKWCDVRNFRGVGSHASRVKFLSGNGGIIIVCRYILAVQLIELGFLCSRSHVWSSYVCYSLWIRRGP